MIEPIEILPIPEETQEQVEAEEEEDVYMSLVEDIHALIAEEEDRHGMIERLLSTLDELSQSFTPMTEDAESDIEGFEYAEDENED